MKEKLIILAVVALFVVCALAYIKMSIECANKGGAMIRGECMCCKIEL